MEARTRRFFMGCGLGCLGLVVIGISSCVGLQVWINTPGELLDSEALLDPQAVGWGEVSLDLEDEGTEALAGALIGVARPPEGMFEGSPVLGFLSEINSRRQERQLRKLFPMTASWTLYPGEPGEPDATLISASVPRMAHTLRLIDWGLGFVAGRDSDLASELYRGERVLVIDEPDRVEVRESGDPIELRIETEAESELGEPDRGEREERPMTLRVFLRDVGIFFATSDQAVRRAIDLLDEPAAEPPAREGVPQLATLLAGLGEAPIRAAVIDDGAGRLARVVERLVDDRVIDGETRRLLGEAESATLVGRFGDAGEIELTLTLAGLEPDETTLGALETAAARLLEEHPDLGGSARVEAAVGGVAVALTLPLAEAAERAAEGRRIIVR
ncbi:MAG TPA: hypothetical protein VMV46_21255 [Thermoanaerobaculia bacterium]|nr:hypothetical protein [Thermoanaerobaculia bacterium]